MLFCEEGRYDLHVELCVKGGHQYEFPHKDAAQLNFSNYSNIVPASFVMYCDLEAMITNTGADCIDVLLQFIQSEVSRVSNIEKCLRALCYETRRQIHA